MFIKKPSGAAEGTSDLYRKAILLVLASSLLAIPATCDLSGGNRTESVPEWELPDEETEEVEDEDLNDNSRERNIKFEPVDDPFYARHA